MLIERTEEEKEFVRKICAKIQKLRVEKEISAQEFAESLGYRWDSSVARLERGDSSTLDIILLLRIAKNLGVDLSYFLDLQE